MRRVAPKRWEVISDDDFATLTRERDAELADFRSNVAARALDLGLLPVKPGKAPPKRALKRKTPKAAASSKRVARASSRKSALAASNES